MRNITLVYAAEGHPTAVRLNRLRKESGHKFFTRSVNVWDGVVEPCRKVYVDAAESPIIQAYIDAGFVLAETALKDRGELPAEGVIRVIRPRRPHADPLTIDLEADERREAKVSAHLTQNRPITKEGQARLADKKKAKAKNKRI